MEVKGDTTFNSELFVSPFTSEHNYCLNLPNNTSCLLFSHNNNCLALIRHPSNTKGTISFPQTLIWGLPAALDVTLISTLQSLTLEGAAAIPGYALTVGDERKACSLFRTLPLNEGFIFSSYFWDLGGFQWLNCGCSQWHWASAESATWSPHCGHCTSFVSACYHRPLDGLHIVESVKPPFSTCRWCFMTTCFFSHSELLIRFIYWVCSHMFCLYLPSCTLWWWFCSVVLLVFASLVLSLLPRATGFAFFMNYNIRLKQQYTAFGISTYMQVSYVLISRTLLWIW